MYDLKAFRERVQELYRRSSPYDDGHRATQRDLAEAVGLNPSELSSRLHQSSGARLTERDVRAIVRALAEWGAIQSQAEARELLALVGCPPFSAAEWQAAPLDLLTAAAAPVTAASGGEPATNLPAPLAGGSSSGYIVIRNKSEPVTNLPAPLSGFIGRERELREVARLLTETRLLTLVGAGGIGKTRLALEATRRLLARFTDGIWLVELAGLHDERLVPQTVAQALGVREQGGEPLIGTLRQALQHRQLLLVLDNCEHLITAAAKLADTLLRGCPDLRIVATSREALRLNGEVRLMVPPLALPAAGRAGDPLGAEATRLFIARARAARPDFSVSDGQRVAVGEICMRLDGIPLAIELAAARVRVMSVESIAARLADRFRLLNGGERTALPRQQTLRALIDWSYDLLTEQERRLLRWLAVFSGGFTLVALEAVCASLAADRYALLELLEGLVEKSLLLLEAQGDASDYRMLETIRAYAAERLAEAGDAAKARAAHLDYYLALAEAAATKLRGAEQASWLKQLKLAHDNLRAALAWAIAQRDAELSLRLAGALWRFWLGHGHLAEGRRWLEQALALDGGTAASRANALNGAGSLALYQGDPAAAHPLYEAALGLQRQLGDRAGIANGLANLGVVAMNQGEYATAHAYYQEGLALDRELGDEWGIARSLINLGIAARLQGDYAAARPLYEESLALFRRLGDQRNLANALSDLGDVARLQGDDAAALARFEDALAIFRELGEKDGVAGVLTGLADIACHRRDYVTARQLLEQSIALRQELDDQQGIAYALEGFASLAVAQRQLNQATKLYAAATALREQLGAPLSPGERDNYERDLATCRTHLGPAFTAAWDEGCTLPLAQAITLAVA